MSSLDANVAAQIARVATALEGVQKALELIARASNCPGDVPPDPLSLLTAVEVAELLQVDVRTLRRMRHERSFPRPTRLGRSVRWKRSLIERWLEGGKR